MTRKMQERQRRDKRIMSLYRRLPIETIAEKENLHFTTIYRIVRKYEQHR